MAAVQPQQCLQVGPLGPPPGPPAGAHPVVAGAARTAVSPMGLPTIKGHRVSARTQEDNTRIIDACAEMAAAMQEADTAQALVTEQTDAWRAHLPSEQHTPMWGEFTARKKKVIETFTQRLLEAVQDYIVSYADAPCGLDQIPTQVLDEMQQATGAPFSQIRTTPYSADALRLRRPLTANNAVPLSLMARSPPDDNPWFTALNALGNEQWQTGGHNLNFPEEKQNRKTTINNTPVITIMITYCRSIVNDTTRLRGDWDQRVDGEPQSIFLAEVIWWYMVQYIRPYFNLLDVSVGNFINQELTIKKSMNSDNQPALGGWVVDPDTCVMKRGTIAQACRDSLWAEHGSEPTAQQVEASVRWCFAQRTLGDLNYNILALSADLLTTVLMSPPAVAAMRSHCGNPQRSIYSPKLFAAFRRRGKVLVHDPTRSQQEVTDEEVITAPAGAFFQSADEYIMTHTRGFRMTRTANIFVSPR